MKLGSLVNELVFPCSSGLFTFNLVSEVQTCPEAKTTFLWIDTRSLQSSCPPLSTNRQKIILISNLFNWTGNRLMLI